MYHARPTRRVFAAGAVLTASLALAACSNDNPLEDPTGDSGDGGDGGSSEMIVIGSQAYYSNEIVAEIYAQALEGAGFTVERQFSIGQRDAYMPEVESGAIDLFPEYTGNLLEFYDPETSATSPEDVYAALQEALPEGLTALDFAEAADQDTYTVLTSFADEHGLASIGDLAGVGEELTLGGAPELEQRPYGPSAAEELYGVDLAFSATAATTLESLQAGEIQVADIYSADPAFQTGELTALEDPENMILSSNVVPIASSDIAEDIADVIDPISAALTTEGLVAMNAQSTGEQLSSADIASSWLDEQGL